jgi:protein-disulfide isomerase
MKTIFTGIVMSLAILCAEAATPAGAPIDQMKPYIQVSTVSGDESTVRAFFSPSCGFSKQYFPLFRNLARTLPESQKFQFTPVVNKRDGLSYAMAYAAVSRFYPAYVNNFVEASLRGVQDIGLSTRNWAGIERIGQAAHIPVPLGRLIENNLSLLQGDVEGMVELQRKLKITNTPSVSVAGTYVVTPEFTGGDTEQFSSLVNAVISMTSDKSSH